MSKEKFFSILILPPKSGKIWKAKLSKVALGIILGVLFLLVLAGGLFSFNTFKLNSYKSKLTKLQTENQYLEKSMGSLQEKVSGLEKEMYALMDKDKKIRIIFGLPEIDKAVREVGIGGPDVGLTLTTPVGEEFLSTQITVDKLLRQVRLEKESFDLIYDKLLEKKTILEHTPSTVPVKGYFSRGFGAGLDPFTGLAQFHQGMDIAAEGGTPIYAPADGKVSSITLNPILGKLVEIDHLYEYKTYYGHLATVKVLLGQKIKRGDLIGTVGNTGYSTGPHLHYEVHFRNKPLNPVNFILDYSF